ncbi:MAG: aspartyl protease family protein [Spirochaetaceae bacterium]|jgi:clan AA aspartic protease|nr:aspartyl protease family protein [Spirochaetaceae bacterium]
MSTVYTEITLRNAIDAANAETGIIKEQEIRQTTLHALVDTGAWTLVINEAIRKKLGLRVTRTDSGTLADGTRGSYSMAGPLEVLWKDRGTICEALVIPHADEILLGAIPLEAMDLIVNPRKEEVVGAHGDQPLHSVKRYSGNREQALLPDC